VSKGPFYAPTAQNSFITAVNKVGWPEIDDLQRFGATNATMRAMRYVSPDGVRSDAAHAYLHPLLTGNNHPNLHVIVDTVVHRVIFENNRAVGVAFSPKTAPDDTPAAAGGEPRIVKARKMVILSAGACGTPLILERSGVGMTEILERAGVPVIADVPGVGSNYQDHQLLVYPYKSNLAPEETADALIAGGMEVVMDLLQRGDKILGWNAQDVTCKLRPCEEDIEAMGPEFRKVWDKHFKDVPDKPLTLMSLVGWCVKRSVSMLEHASLTIWYSFPALDPSLVIEPGQYFGISVFSSYPLSRGHIHITGPNIDDPIDFETPIYNDPDDFDITVARWAFKKQREIARRMDIYRGAVAMANPAFPDASKAASSTEKEYPLPQDVQDIEYDAEDDVILDKFLQANAGSTWHSLGSCKMAALENGGVVDANLSVYGVQGLKVADLSIPPSNVGCNTNNTALMIGEKAAEIFIRELRLDKKSA
jgi:choline dehydrogenase-like flavoprotein